jgi:arylsulfatase A-like enzyme
MAPLALGVSFLGLGMLMGPARWVAPRALARLAPIGLVALGSWSILATIPGLNSWVLVGLVLAIGYRLGRRARFDSAAFRRLARISFPALAGLWLARFVATGVVPTASEAWSLRMGPEPPAGAPNVLLVVLDTVRADNLSLHGYHRPTSPRLAERASRGVRFDQARATSPYTLGTHASLFTGHWMSRTSARVNAPLDGSRPTLAEHLRGRGYATGGFVGNIFYGSAHYGLDRGFLRYLDIPGNITRRVTPREFLRSSRLGESLLTRFEMKWRLLAPMQRLRLDADQLNREALAWVDSARPHGRPFFLFLNYFDAHSPYSLPADAPQPFSPTTADRLEARLGQLERAEERLEAQARPAPAAEAEVTALRAEVASALRGSYDDGIAYIDRKLDELLEGLDRRGLLDNTLVVVTADHGEMLGEHRVIGHGKSLDRQVVHVPLVISGPRRNPPPAGRVVSRPVSVRDIPATVLDLIGDPDPGRFPGRSLARHWLAGAVAEEDDGPVLSEMEHLSWRPHTPRIPAAFGPLWLLTEGRWSYHRRDHETLGRQERLFELVEDPGEDRDLAADPAHRATLESFRSRLQTALAPGG